MTDRDRNLIAELERRLRWYRDEATEEEFDAEEVDAICVMLQKLSPIEEPHMSKEEAYQNIMRRVQEEEKEKSEEKKEKTEENGADDTDKKEKATRRYERKKILLPDSRRYRAAILFITVFGAALLSLNMVTYAREDKSLFTMILERVGLVEIVKEEAVEGTLYENDKIKTFYDNWADLDSNVKEKLDVPQYVPDDYELYGIYYYSLNNRKKIKANYYNNENGHLKISVTIWEDGEEPYKEMAIDEEVCILLSKYSDENTLYYIYEDEFICMVSMKNSFYRISGNITLEEMIKVREGLSGDG